MHKVKSFLKNNVGIIAIIVGMLFFRTAVADWSPVPTPSMEPTIYPGDVLLVNKTILGPAIPFTESRLFSIGKPQRGDIITFYPPGIDQQYVKRVIGVPGDLISVEGMQVFVNGEPLSLSVDVSAVTPDAEQLQVEETIDGITHSIKVFLDHGIRSQQTLEVPPGHYFVMGDFRNNSEDSRFWGTVPEEQILGKVTRLMFSIADERSFFDSIAQPLR